MFSTFYKTLIFFTLNLIAYGSEKVYLDQHNSYDLNFSIENILRNELCKNLNIVELEKNVDDQIAADKINFLMSRKIIPQSECLSPSGKKNYDEFSKDIFVSVSKGKKNNFILFLEYLNNFTHPNLKEKNTMAILSHMIRNNYSKNDFESFFSFHPNAVGKTKLFSDELLTFLINKTVNFQEIFISNNDEFKAILDFFLKKHHGILDNKLINFPPVLPSMKLDQNFYQYWHVITKLLSRRDILLPFGKLALGNNWLQSLKDLLSGSSPLGFRSVQEFNLFKKDLLQTIRFNVLGDNKKYIGYIQLIGSSTTFFAMNAKKTNFSQALKILSSIQNKGVTLEKISNLYNSLSYFDKFKARDGIKSDLDIHFIISNFAKICAKRKVSGNDGVRSVYWDIATEVDSFKTKSGRLLTGCGLTFLLPFKERWQKRLNREIGFSIHILPEDIINLSGETVYDGAILDYSIKEPSGSFSFPCCLL
jgi:hypothetical protein